MLPPEVAVPFLLRRGRLAAVGLTVLTVAVGLSPLVGSGASAATRDRGRSDWVSDPALWLYSEGTFHGQGLSADGHYALFEGRSHHYAGAGDGNGNNDVFRRDMTTGVVETVSVRAAGDRTGNNWSAQSTMSADGRYVTFVSQATDLDDSVTDTYYQDVFLRDMTTGHTTMISRSADGRTGGDDRSENPRITPDGRYVVFQSSARNLVATPGAGPSQVYRYDHQARTVELVSAGPGGVFANRDVGEPSVSANGRYVAFATWATNLGASPDPADFSDVFLRDMTKQTTTLVSRAVAGGPAGGSTTPKISADGSTVGFLGTWADRLTGHADTNRDAADLFVWDRSTAALELITKASGGGAAANNGTYEKFSLSADGRVLAFVSKATNLVAGVRDANNAPPPTGAGSLPTLDYWEGDVYLRRRSANQTVLVSRSASDPDVTGDHGSDNPLISADGRMVTFESNAGDLVAGVVDTNNTGEGDWDYYGHDVFSYRVSDGELRVVSLDDSAAGSKTLALTNEAPAISADGRFVAFDNLWRAGNSWVVRRSLEPAPGESTPSTTGPGGTTPSSTGPGSSGPPSPTPGITAAVPSDPTPSKPGYWMVGSDGAVYGFGAASAFGNAPTATAVDLEPTRSGKGYWIVDETGRVFAFGDAVAHGGMDRSGLGAGEKVTSLSATPSGAGYWIFTDRGRVLPFGDASFLGDMRAARLAGPVLDSIPTPSGRGYYMVSSDGGIFAFGDAIFAGSMGGRFLAAPVQSLVPDADGLGYWLVASDGGIFAFDAGFHGSMGATRLNRPVTGMVRAGRGYLMVGEDGGIFDFSGTPDGFQGSLGARPPARPIVAVAVVP
jgi:Tol biopolymer transport system component